MVKKRAEVVTFIVNFHLDGQVFMDFCMHPKSKHINDHERTCIGEYVHRHQYLGELQDVRHRRWMQIRHSIGLRYIVPEHNKSILMYQYQCSLIQ